MNLPASTLLQDLDAFYQHPSSDPAPLYRRLHREARVIKDTSGTWVIAGYDDAQAISVSRSVIWKSRVAVLAEQGPLGPADKLRSHFVAESEGEVHKRLRQLVSLAFTPRLVDQLRDRIARIANELMDGVIARGSMDMVKDFAYPLPITVIAEILGIAEEDRPLLIAATYALVMGDDQNATEQDRTHADEMAERFTAMIGRYIDECRVNSRANILGALVAAEEAGDRLSRDELISTCFVIVGAGHETTANVLSSLIYRFLADRPLWERLKENPSLIPAAVDEGLRLDPPLRINRERVAETDLALRGGTIPAGEPVTVWIGAANRDEALFENPDAFSFERPASRHMAFSVGPHFCLGAQLARLELQIALDCLLRRLPDLELAERDLNWRPIVRFRSLERLPLKWA